MSRDRREKASDVFRNTDFLFSEKASFSVAFPEIKMIAVEVDESSAGVGGTTRRFEFRPFLGCLDGYPFPLRRRVCNLGLTNGRGHPFRGSP